MKFIRMNIVKKNNSSPANRVTFEARYGQVWDAEEFEREFRVLGQMPPFVAVERKSDGVKGHLRFFHSPRFYFLFTEKRK